MFTKLHFPAFRQTNKMNSIYICISQIQENKLMYKMQLFRLLLFVFPLSYIFCPANKDKYKNYIRLWRRLSFRIIEVKLVVQNKWSSETLFFRRIPFPTRHDVMLICRHICFPSSERTHTLVQVTKRKEWEL